MPLKAETDLKFKLSHRHFRNITALYSAAPDGFKTTEMFVSTTVNILCVFGSEMLRPPSCQHFIFVFFCCCWFFFLSVAEAEQDDTDHDDTKKTLCSVDLPSAKKNDLPRLYSRIPHV